MKKLISLVLIIAVSAAYSQNKAGKSQFLKNNHSGLKAASVASVSNLYTFSTFTAPYVPITGASLSNGEKWDDLDYAVPLGFNFQLYGKQSNTYTLYLGGQVLSPDDLSTATELSFVAAMFEDLCDRAYNPATDVEGDPGGLSPITYTTTGTPGNRICKIQISNAAFFSELDLAANDTSNVNFQIWLYEGTNDIELRYGIVNIQNQLDNLNNGTDGFMAGLTNELDIANFTSSGGSNMLQGPSASPSVVAWSSSFNTAVTPNISNGRVYRFQRNNPNTGLNEIKAQQFYGVYPNPVSSGHIITITGEQSRLDSAEITDMSGRIIKIADVVNHQLSTESLKPGVYILKLKEKNQTKAQTRLVVTE